MSRTPTDAATRFWLRIYTNGPSVVPALGPCWQWLGKPHRSGYGRHFDGNAVVYAHRFSYELLVAPIPDGLQLDHLCRNTMCVRPEHLDAVTPRVNVARSLAPSAINSRKTHCPQGHPLFGDNVYMHKTRGPGPGRRCRTCNTQRAREYRRRRVAAKRVAA